MKQFWWEDLSKAGYEILKLIGYRDIAPYDYERIITQTDLFITLKISCSAFYIIILAYLANV